MTTVLQYLVIAAVIGLVVFALAVLVFGRGEQLAPLSPRVSPTELPDREMTADDVRKVRFAMALRGYRMSDVDWALERMADELDRLRGKVAVISGQSAGGEPASAESASSASFSGDSSLVEDPDGGEPRAGSTSQASSSVGAGMTRGGAGRHQRPGFGRTTGDPQTDAATTSGDTP